MSSYLFDTCIVRHWYDENPVIEARVNALDPDDEVYISAITLGEIECGHLSPAAKDKDKQADFRKWMRTTFEIPELCISEFTAQEYAKFRRRLFERFDKKGKYTENREDMLGAKVGIDENDLWLVAQAAERHLTLVTNDAMSNLLQIVDGEVMIQIWPDK